MFSCTSASLGRHEHGGRCPHSERFIPFQRIFVCGFGVFFLLYHGRDFCALTSLLRERMGLGQLLHQASGDGWWEVGLMQQGWHSVGLSSQPPAAASCSLSSCFQTSSWEAVGAEPSSVRALFCSILNTQECRLIPPLFLLLLYKIQRGCGVPPASTGEDLPNTGINPALLSTLWALAQLNHHFHTIKQKNSKHTIKKPFYNPMYTHTVDTSLTPFALFFVF